LQIHFSGFFFFVCFVRIYSMDTNNAVAVNQNDEPESLLFESTADGHLRCMLHEKTNTKISLLPYATTKALQFVDIRNWFLLPSADQTDVATTTPAVKRSEKKKHKKSAIATTTTPSRVEQRTKRGVTLNKLAWLQLVSKRDMVNLALRNRFTANFDVTSYLKISVERKTLPRARGITVSEVVITKAAPEKFYFDTANDDVENVEPKFKGQDVRQIRTEPRQIRLYPAAWRRLLKHANQITALLTGPDELPSYGDPSTDVFNSCPDVSAL
jgi:hypothetical protein